MSDERSRPLGVTLMGILTLLSAVLWLIIGAGLIMLLGATLIQVQPIPDLQPMPESDAAMGPVLFLDAFSIPRWHLDYLIWKDGHGSWQ